MNTPHALPCNLLCTVACRAGRPVNKVFPSSIGQALKASTIACIERHENPPSYHELYARGIDELSST